MGTENYKRILILCAVLAVGIVAISVIFTLKGDDKDKGKKNGKGTANEKFDPDGTVNGRTPQDVIIKNIDLDSSEITVEDIETGENRKLVFTGGSDIRTKTGRIISAAMLGVGNIVKITSDEENKLISLYGHDKVWSYKNIERIRIEENPKKIEVGNSIYRYDRLNVLNEDEFIDIKSLITDGTDVLDMYGIDDRVYLIKVNTGHGYLTLMNQEDFTGGTISYGVGKSTEITEDIKLTLREGDYNIRIEKDGNEAAATVRIKNNETTAFDLTGYGLEPVTYQEITFKISPEESDLYIDGVKTPFKDPVKLSIGHHEIEAVLGGYNDYKGSIEVGDGSTVKMISLSPAPEEKPEDIVYDDTPPEEEDKESDSTDVTPTAPPVNDSGSGKTGEGTDNADLSEYSGVNIPDTTSDDGDNGDIEVIDGDKSGSEKTGNSGGNGEKTGNGSGDNGQGNVSITISGDTSVDGNEEDADMDDFENDEEDSDENDSNGGDPQEDQQGGNSQTTDNGKGKLILRTSEGTEIYIDGKYAGKITGGELRIAKPSGTIKLELRKPGYVTKEYTLTLDDEEEEELYKFPDMTPE